MLCVVNLRHAAFERPQLQCHDTQALALDSRYHRTDQALAYPIRLDQNQAALRHYKPRSLPTAMNCRPFVTEPAGIYLPRGRSLPGSGNVPETAAEPDPGAPEQGEYRAEEVHRG